MPSPNGHKPDEPLDGPVEYQRALNELWFGKTVVSLADWDRTSRFNHWSALLRWQATEDAE